MGYFLTLENLRTQRGTQKVLSEFGHTYDWAFKAKLMGKRTDEVAKMVVEHYKLPMEPNDWIDRTRKVYDELFPSVPALPGVAKLVHHLSRNQIKMAVATSSSSHSFKLKTSNHAGLFSLFDKLVLGDDPRVGNAKPAPDIFLVAAEELGEDPQHLSCFFEDAPL